MLVKKLGTTGVSIPEVGIGTWNYHAGQYPLRMGLEAGALFVDTAEEYGTESVVGEAVKGMRERVFLATKVSPEHFRRADFLKSVDCSLHRLGTDWIDLLQLHQPNPSISIAETMGAVRESIDAGKVRFAGVSNFSTAQLREAQAALGRYPIVSSQVRYHIADRTIEKGLLQYCQANRVTIIAYCPLGRDLQRIFDCDPAGVIGQVARSLGKTPAQVILNWCLCKDGVVAIPKGNSMEHILDNCGASDWRLSPEDLASLDAQIQFRHRNRLDHFVRRYTPGPMLGVAKRLVSHLPRGVRRRVS